jgi:hypothetical protein
MQMVRRLSDDGLMQLHLLFLGACLLVLAVMPIGNGMAYFSYVLLFLPALVAPAWLHAGYAAAREVRIVVLGVGAATTLYLATVFGFNLATTVSTLTRSAQQQTAAALQDANDGAGLGRRVIARSWRETTTLFGHLRRQLEHTAWHGLLQQIGAASAVANLQVYVPPAADEFWLRLKRGQTNPHWCLESHLMIPAQLGIPLIHGIAPLRYEAGCSPIAGLYGFGKQQDAHRTRELSEQQLCEIAQARHLGAVYILNAISTPAANRILACTASAGDASASGGARR